VRRFNGLIYFPYNAIGRLITTNQNFFSWFYLFWWFLNIRALSVLTIYVFLIKMHKLDTVTETTSLIGSEIINMKEVLATNGMIYFASQILKLDRW
jgi:hypothetical protein